MSKPKDVEPKINGNENYVPDVLTEMELNGKPVEKYPSTEELEAVVALDPDATFRHYDPTTMTWITWNVQTDML